MKISAIAAMRELVVTLVVQDFARYRPNVVAVPSTSHAYPVGVDLLAFLTEDDRIRKV